MIAMKDVHTVPVEDLRKHVLTRHCWCGPELHDLCYECGQEDDPSPNCWACNGEGILVVDADREADLHIIHNALDGRT